MLYYSGSGFFFWVLWNKVYVTIENYFRISSMLLPFPSHLANFSRRKVCKPEASVLWYTWTNLSTCVARQISLQPPSSNAPQWSLIPAQCCRRQASFRARQGQHPTAHSLGSGCLLLACVCFPIPIYLRTPGFRWFIPRSHSSRPGVSLNNRIWCYPS